jgi:allophanate hydrolase subunit 2
VPPSGMPVVFLADHPPTGGYPVIGVVAADDLWQCAQLRPGDRVRFTRVSPGPRPPAPGGATA